MAKDMQRGLTPPPVNLNFNGPRPPDTVTRSRHTTETVMDATVGPMLARNVGVVSEIGIKSAARIFMTGQEFIEEQIKQGRDVSDLIARFSTIEAGHAMAINYVQGFMVRDTKIERK